MIAGESGKICETAVYDGTSFTSLVQRYADGEIGTALHLGATKLCGLQGGENEPFVGRGSCH